MTANAFVLIAMLLTIAPCPANELVVTGPTGNILERTWVREGDLVRISHINSIYDAAVEEVLAITEGQFELRDVITTSAGVGEYYRAIEGIQGYRFPELIIVNSIDRNFQAVINDRPLKSFPAHRNVRLKLSIIGPEGVPSAVTENSATGCQKDNLFNQ